METKRNGKNQHLRPRPVQRNPSRKVRPKNNRNIFTVITCYYATYEHVLKIFCEQRAFECLLGAYDRIYKKINLLKNKIMRKTDSKRINIWVDLTLYNQIKKSADDSYLRVGTYTRQLIQQAMKNNNTNN